MSVQSSTKEITSLIKNIGSEIQSITLAPIKDIVIYAFPCINTFFERQHLVTKTDRSITNLIGGDSHIDSLQRETAQLAQAAGIAGKKISLYTAAKTPFSGNRGICNRLITLPTEHIHKKSFDEVKSDEHLLTDEELEKSKWDYSENEVRFLMSSSLAEVTLFPLLKVIARVAILGLAIGLLFTPLSLHAGMVAYGIGVILYLLIDRMVANRTDLRAQKILKERFKQAGMSDRAAEIQSAAVGINILKKLKFQQLERRTLSKSSKYVIDAEGNRRLDFRMPSFKKRIGKLEKILFGQLEEILSPPSPSKRLASRSSSFRYFPRSSVFFPAAYF